MAYDPPVPHAAGHPVDGFDCGKPSLNEWLTRHAVGAGVKDAVQRKLRIAKDAWVRALLTDHRFRPVQPHPPAEAAADALGGAALGMRSGHGGIPHSGRTSS